MKKVIPFLLVFILGIGIGFACGTVFGFTVTHYPSLNPTATHQTYTPDPNRWTELDTDIYIEKDSIRYSNNGNTVEIWACFVHPQINQYVKENIRLHKHTKKFLVLQTTNYNSKTEKEYSTQKTQKILEEHNTEKIVPDSPVEVIYNHVFSKQQ